MQRSIRFNPMSEVLWSYYFDVECFNNLKLVQRQAFLNIEIDYSLLDTTSVIVFKHAIRAIPTIEFACKLYQSSLMILGGGYTSNILEIIMMDRFGHDNIALIKNILLLKLNTALTRQNDNIDTNNNNDSKNSNNSKNISTITTCIDALTRVLDICSQFTTTTTTTNNNDNNTATHTTTDTITSLSTSLSTNTVTDKSILCAEIIYVSLENITQFLMHNLYFTRTNTKESTTTTTTTLGEIEIDDNVIRTLKSLLIKCCNIIIKFKTPINNSHSSSSNNNNSIVILGTEFYLWYISYALQFQTNILDIHIPTPIAGTTSNILSNIPTQSVLEIQQKDDSSTFIHIVQYFFNKINSLSAGNNSISYNSNTYNSNNNATMTSDNNRNSDVMTKFFNLYLSTCLNYNQLHILNSASNNSIEKGVVTNHSQQSYEKFIEKLCLKIIENDNILSMNFTIDSYNQHIKSAHQSKGVMSLLRWFLQSLPINCDNSILIKVFQKIITNPSISLEERYQSFALYLKILNSRNVPVLTCCHQNVKNKNITVIINDDDDDYDDDTEQVNYIQKNDKKRKLNCITNNKQINPQKIISIQNVFEWFQTIHTTTSIPSTNTIEILNNIIIYILKILLQKQHIELHMHNLTFYEKTQINNFNNNLVKFAQSNNSIATSSSISNSQLQHILSLSNQLKV